MWQCLLLAGITAFSASAQDLIETLADKNAETTVFGEAQTPDGSANEFLVEQPQDSGNPLGNPITGIAPVNAQNNAENVQIQPATTRSEVVQNSLQNPSISQMTPEQMGNEIQNKLYQEGNRVYDVQSYPVADFETINQNGQDEAITNYPAY